ncbi:GntR family transcriptional regulator with an aminotransferase domain [Psychroflexus torquis ATCC 700755]|uniref:GntR family transcriptional regulator with an aminotransferase domain n=1 Tax=Psychroflexus torquis (strain ATCC 700755 / CIP 106069 / ACAM 623) TaxID=313595 RepID=K4IFZ2_PSYTT|nr:PLP-dependent aminotransferase family protein [Psychroflexus torquis]AFU69452.1 GntR family transcriptional regulator with an aminotransferase domain [Psychroflexus torquis ATCC 700755]
MHTSSDFILNLIKGELSLTEGELGLAKYLKIKIFIKAKIEDQSIPRESQLPSTRKLSEVLGVSRSTTVKAFELLLIEGSIESRPGSGYWVKKIDISYTKTERISQLSNYPEISKRGKLFSKNVGLLHSTDEKFVAFRPGLPPLDVFPINQWKKISDEYWRRVKFSSLSFSDSSGIEVFKKNVANYLNLVRGIKCDYQQIIIVSGSLQSLYLIGNALLNPKDTIVMENPTFPNVQSIFKSLGTKINELPLDNQGIKIKDYKSKGNTSPKLIHLTPSNHYPTGVRMSKQRKLEILEWASSHKAVIIENDYDHEISNWKDRQEAIFSLDRENRTVFLGTFNRLLHQSVRLGYMVVPYYLLDVIKALQKHSHRFVSPSNQFIMSQFIEKNYIYNHIKNVVNIAEKRRSIFIDNFKKYMPPSVKIMYSEARSLHLLAEIPDHLSDRIIKDNLSILNINVHHYSNCFINNNKQGFIFGYSCVKRPVIEKAIRELSHTYKSYEKSNH